MILNGYLFRLLIRTHPSLPLADIHLPGRQGPSTRILGHSGNGVIEVEVGMNKPCPVFSPVFFLPYEPPLYYILSVRDIFLPEGNR
jgi:hypothetical protein